MIFNRTILALSALLWLSLPLVSGGRGLAVAAEDLENRFIYADYSKKISMDFKDASLIDILKIFSKQSGMNFISTGEVSGKKITLFLDNIPIEEALDKILDANDLTYEMAANSDVFVVKPKAKEQVITKVYPLKYASVSNATLATKGSKGGITDAVKGVLSKNGKLLEDSRTNSFIITDAPDQFPMIEEMIGKLDTPVAQILIQVEMLDVSKSTSDKIGATYTTTLGYQAGDKITVNGNSTAHDKSEIFNSGMTVDFDFIKSQVDTKSLARPKILTLNNQTAKIQISTDQAIGVSSITQTTTQGTGTVTATAERSKTGVFLEVTPQANEVTGEILLRVNPKVSDASGKSTFGSGASAVSFFNPEERSSESMFKVKSGETIMIGGLLRTTNSKDVSKLPFLGETPVVGAAFRHNAIDENQRELIIFITPYIVNDKNKQRFDNDRNLHLSREMTVPAKQDVVNEQLDTAEMGNQ